METRIHSLQKFLGQRVHIVVDRPIGYSHNGTIYPVNYGFIPGVIAEDGEAQDAYILGINEPLSSFDGQVIGAVCRKNDCEDKLIVAPEGTLLHQAQIEEAVRFQEKYFDHFILSVFRKSCGVIPYRMVDGQRQYLLVFESFSKCWSLPKGHMEPEETEMQTALRELQEETGLSACLIENTRMTVEYPISSFARKQVVFFLGEVTGIPRPREGEIEQLRWVTQEELANYLHPDFIHECIKQSVFIV